MLHTRVIPCLLLKDRGLVKGVNFRNHRYVGDPINAVKIFNEKEADELIFLDITATQENRLPDLEHVAQTADECYMPFVVGGGIRQVEDIRRVLYVGAEKVSINTAAVEKPELIREASRVFGSQSIVASIDVKTNKQGTYEVYTRSGTKSTGISPVEHAVEMERLGAGEILLNSIDHDGTMGGYDLRLIKTVSESVSIPVIACGGAGGLADLAKVILEGRASAAAAGSLFVFHGRRRAVLVNYPSRDELGLLFGL